MNEFEYKMRITKIGSLKSGKALRQVLNELTDNYTYNAVVGFKGQLLALKCIKFATECYKNLHLKTPLPDNAYSYMDSLRYSLRSWLLANSTDIKQYIELEEVFKTPEADYGYIPSEKLAKLCTVFSKELPPFKVKLIPISHSLFTNISPFLGVDITRLLTFMHLKNEENMDSKLLDALIAEEIANTVTSKDVLEDALTAANALNLSITSVLELLKEENKKA
jgi:hypothetical protein